MPNSCDPNRPEQKGALAVEGMHCGSCARRVGEALATDRGVHGHQVDLASQQVSVVFDPTLTSLDAIRTVLDEAGYPARPL